MEYSANFPTARPLETRKLHCKTLLFCRKIFFGNSGFRGLLGISIADIHIPSRTNDNLQAQKWNIQQISGVSTSEKLEKIIVRLSFSVENSFFGNSGFRGFLGISIADIHIPVGEMTTYKLRNGIFSKFPVFLKKSEEIRADDRDEKSIDQKK